MITKMKAGKHTGEFQVRIQPINKVTGKRESWPVQYAKNKRSATTLERKMWIDYENGLDMADGNSIFVDELEKYVRSRKKLISVVTQKDWDYTVKVCRQYFGKAKIRDINQRVMNDFAHDFVAKHHSTVSKSSVVARRLVHIRKFFKTLEGKVIKDNPIPERFLKFFFQQRDLSVKTKQYLFTDEELSSIKVKIRSELRHSTVGNVGSKLALWIDLETGMRPGELQALRFQNLITKDGYPTFKINDSWSDVTCDFNGSLKSRPHGDFRYCLPISDELAATIKQYEKDQQYFLSQHNISNPQNLIFLNLHDYKAASNHVPIRQKSINLMMKRICNDLDIANNGEKLSLYSFRHTLCTKLANRPGMSYPWAASRMGHSVEMFMKTYVRVDRDIDKQMERMWSE